MSVEAPAWYDPDQTVWLQGPGVYNSNTKKGAYRKVIASGATHLQREVRACLPKRSTIAEPWPNHSVDELWEAAALTDKEFALLERHGVAVPEVEWHIVEDRLPRAQLVARVAIVQGIQLTDLSDTSLYGIYRHRVHSYAQSPEPGTRLFDVHLGQCMVGNMRIDTEAPSALYMIDPEPIFD